MKIFIAILVVISLMNFALEGCKKSDSVKEEKDEFSFIYNGKIYKYSITNNLANAGASKGIDGTPSIEIYMNDVFGGQIHFEKSGYAYFIPSDANYQIDIDEDYIFTAKKYDGGIIPIDSAKVFLYKSGSLNVNFSNCVVKSGIDYSTGLAYSNTDCAAIGTFDLTLMNIKNETIKITDGIVRIHHVTF